MFTHLHTHSMFSTLDGHGTPESIISKVKELGMKAVALTDHANVDGMIKMQKVAQKEGVQLIVGCELYIVPNLYDKQRGEKRAHCTVWVMNKEGWVNLLKMLTIANAEGFYYRPRIDPSTLTAHSKGLVVGGACEASWIKESYANELVKELKNKSVPIFVEVMPFNSSKQLAHNKRVVQFAQKHELDIIATNDVHYVDESDATAQEVMLAIQTKADWDDEKRWKFGIDGLYLKSKQEMVEAFKNNTDFNRRDYQKWISNTQKVVELCKDFRIEQMQVELPRVPTIPKEYTDAVYLQLLIDEGFKEKVTDKGLDIKVYQDRVREEMEAIHEKGFERYFLMVWEMINWANENGVMTGPGRGSAGGSLVCYLLGITQVDPIKFNLLFSRFIDRERTDLPDIDTDYSNKDLVRTHLDQLYGRKNVAGISTFFYMKGRSAIRDVCRTFKVPYDITDAVAKSVSFEDETVGSIDDTEVGYKFKRDYPLQYELAKKLDGQIRGRGQHACGIVVSQHDLSNGEHCALVSNKADGSDLITNWDKDDLEYCGLMKVDVLGLSELQVLQKAQQLIGNDFSYNDIDLGDRRCLREFTKGNTVGCFQVGTEGLRDYCRRLKIDNFMMLSHATSLYRPGPLGSGMAEDFIERKNGRQKWSLIHPSMEQFVGDTYGLIIYQEQVMQIVAEVAGLGWGIANKIRKVIAKSQGADKMREYQQMFVEGCKKMNTLNEHQANTMFEQFIAFGAYSFNRSHAVEYSHITFWDMYLKVYYPKEFYCASLTYCSDTHRQELIDDAWRNGVEIRPSKVGKSLALDWNIVDGILYAPFVYIKGVGVKTAEKVASTKKTAGATMGFFTKEQPKTTKYEQILEEIRAYDDEELTVQEARRIKEYFGVLLRSAR